MPNDQTIELPFLQGNLPCYGSYLYGQDFLQAAEDFTGRPASVVPLFLRCQAIELGLKAFLLRKGVSGDQLRNRPYGHDLSKLLNEAMNRGLAQFVQIDRAEEEAIATATSFYDSGPDARRRLQYFDVGMVGHRNGLPDAALLQQVAVKLVRNNQLEAEHLNA